MADYTHVSQVYDLVYRERVVDARFYQQAVARAGRGGGRRVLEIGAGTGRVLEPIARSHADVAFTALDLDADELDVLRGKVAEGGLTNVDIVCQDLMDMSWKAEFDLVTAPFRVLQHCLSAETLSAAFARVHCALKPGGAFIFDLFNPSIDLLARTGLVVSQDFADEDGAVVHREVHVNERSYFDQVQHVEEYYRVAGPGVGQRELSWIYDTRYFFKGEVEPLLRMTGFEVESVSSDFAGTPFGEGSYPGDLVFTAVKPYC
jgi:SAM-dependent methyltransferase